MRTSTASPAGASAAGSPAAQTDIGAVLTQALKQFQANVRATMTANAEAAAKQFAEMSEQITKLKDTLNESKKTTGVTRAEEEEVEVEEAPVHPAHSLYL